jgi:hypothetical protein
MDTLQGRLEQLENTMKNILGVQPTQGTVEGTQMQQDVSNESNLPITPSSQETSPARPFDGVERTVDPALILLFRPQLYQKLPHPFSSLLKELPVVDGTNVDCLWEFLLQALRMVQVGQFSVPHIYEVLYPCCKGEVLTLLEQSLVARDSFETFHEHLLQRFIPKRLLLQLRIQRYERVQAHDESLAAYVRAVREAASVLRITETELQVVQRILEGLTPNQRAKFVFQTPPCTFQQLDLLVIVDREISVADSMRQPVAAACRDVVVQPTVTYVNANSADHPPSDRYARRKGLVCYHCGKPGHIQKNCFVEQQSRRVTAPDAGNGL